MVQALDKVFGHLLLVVLCEVLFVLLVLAGDGPWFEQRYGVLAALGLGALGVPVTVLVPYLVTQDNAFSAVVLLVSAPPAVLLMRFLGVYLRADGATILLDLPDRPSDDPADGVPGRS